MASLEAGPQPGDKDLHAALDALEKRVARLEASIGIEPEVPAPAPSSWTSETMGPATEGEAVQPAVQSPLELRIGEFGLPWIASIVLLLGIVFLMGFVGSLGHPAVASGLGYLSCGALYLLSTFWKSRLSLISRILQGCSLILLYYTTLRLHFYSADPILSSRNLTLLLMLSVVFISIRIALVQNSQSLAGLALALWFVSAALADSTHVTLLLGALAAMLGAYLLLRRKWWAALFATVILAYAGHLLWLLGNPLVGHPLRAASEHQFNLVYLFVYAALFSCFVLIPDDHLSAQARSNALAVLNSLGFFAVAALVVFVFFRREFAHVYLAIAAFFLLLSIAARRTSREFVPVIYACVGYLSLSVAIYGYEGIPGAFLWLSLQSLLVVSMALWFRSKILVVLNSLMYVGILVAYVGGSPSSDLANFSFALVALTSARIMNWQRERLTLRTKSLRNVFLSISLLFMLYALHHAVPPEYVTLSWTLAAVGYFTLSLVLKNVKYRWMAMFTLGVTVVYLFLVDLARLDPVFRIVAFLFLGLMALLLSLFYSRIRRLIGKDVK